MGEEGKGPDVLCGKWSDDPKGKAALSRWLDEKDALLAGRNPREKVDPEVVTIADVCNRFLNFKADRRDAGKKSPRTYRDCFDTCARIVDAFGMDRPVSGLSCSDWAKLRKRVEKRRGPVALSNEIQRIRTI